MNSKQRFLARIQGEPVDRPPNFDLFTTYAAHYIGQPLSSYYLDYRILAEANLALLEAFHVDVVQVISDPFREAADFGAEVLFPPDALPYCTQPLLVDPGSLLTLKPPDPYNGRRMSDRLMAVRYLKEQVGDEVPVMGWVEGPLTEASILRGGTELLVDLTERPEWVHELLEVTTSVAIQFAKLQTAMGAEIIGLGEVIFPAYSPEVYRQFALPYEQRIFQAVHELGALGRLHAGGSAGFLLTDILESGADIIDVDSTVNLEQAARLSGQTTALCGNLDALKVFLNGNPELVYRETQLALTRGGPRCLSAASSEILDGTPEENLQAQARALSEFR